MTSYIKDKEFFSYFNILTESQKESLLLLIKSFIKNEERISIDDYNKELEAAEERIVRGKYIEQDDLEKQINYVN